MGRAITTLAVMSVTLLLTASCQSLTGTTVGTKVDDAAITAAVKTKLVANMASNLTRVDVDTNRGTVYLHGSVDTAEQRARAEAIARRARGVNAVVNELQIVQKR